MSVAARWRHQRAPGAPPARRPPANRIASIRHSSKPRSSKKPQRRHLQRKPFQHTDLQQNTRLPSGIPWCLSKLTHPLVSRLRIRESAGFFYCLLGLKNVRVCKARTWWRWTWARFKRVACLCPVLWRGQGRKNRNN